MFVPYQRRIEPPKEARCALVRTEVQPLCLVAQPDIQLCNGSSRYVTGFDFCHVARLSPERESGYARLSDRCEDAKEAFEAYISPTSPVEGKRT